MKSVPLHERPICSYIPQLKSLLMDLSTRRLRSWPSLRIFGARDGCRPHVPSVEDWYTICCTTQAYVIDYDRTYTP